MKNQIVKMVEELDGNVSFVELQKIPGFSGEQALGLSKINIVYWVGVSSEAVQAIHDLVAEKVIELDPTDIMTYMNDGVTMPLPLVKDLGIHEETRWTPMVINKGVNFYRLLAREEADA